MKLILELNYTDIDSVFKECYPENLKPSQMSSYHFNTKVRELWNQMDEIWFIERAVLQKTDDILYELSPKTTRLK